jgi:hypothetical protein
VLSFVAPVLRGEDITPYILILYFSWQFHEKNVCHNDYGLEKAELEVALKMQREGQEQTH